MAARVCPRGHAVIEDDLKACPRCGGRLALAQYASDDDPTAEASHDPYATEARAAVSSSQTTGKRAPLGPVFVAIGVFGAFCGYLLKSTSGHGPAEYFSFALLVLAGAILAIGTIAVGVSLGLRDSGRQ